MPGNLSWSDTFNAMIVPDTISYKLPRGVRIDDAPSKLIIEGFGTLPMQRTRVSVHNNQLFHMVDETERQPLRASVTTLNMPTLQAPQAGPSNRARNAPLNEAHGPVLGIGVGQPERDTPLYTVGRMLLFGLSLAAVAVGSMLVGTASSALGATLLVCGTLGALIALMSNPYHLVGPVPAAEAARAARANQADLQDALA